MDAREHAIASNEIAAVVIEQGAEHMPDVFMHLGFRYGIADALLALGYRKDHKPIDLDHTDGSGA